MTNAFRQMCTCGCQSSVDLKQFSRAGPGRLPKGGNTLPGLQGTGFSRRTCEGQSSETRPEGSQLTWHWLPLGNPGPLVFILEFVSSFVTLQLSTAVSSKRMGGTVVDLKSILLCDYVNELVSPAFLLF